MTNRVWRALIAAMFLGWLVTTIIDHALDSLGMLWAAALIIPIALCVGAVVSALVTWATGGEGH